MVCFCRKRKMKTTPFRPLRSLGLHNRWLLSQVLRMQPADGKVPTILGSMTPFRSQCHHRLLPPKRRNLIKISRRMRINLGNKDQRWLLSFHSFPLNSGIRFFTFEPNSWTFLFYSHRYIFQSLFELCISSNFFWVHASNTGHGLQIWGITFNMWLLEVTLSLSNVVKFWLTFFLM